MTAAPCRWLVAAWVAALLGAVAFWFVCDDAYIAFTYARNLVAGHGLVWYPGDAPVEGYSDPLWVLWLASCLATGVPPEVAAPVTSLACSAALLWWLHALVRRRVGRDAAAAGSLFLALLPPFWVWSTGGLETMPAALASFATFAFLLGDPDRPRGLAAGVSAAALALLRPEGIALALLWIALAARRERGTYRSGRCSPAVVAAVVLGIAIAAWLAFRLLYYGDWLPNTVRAKGGLYGFRLVRGLDYVLSFGVVFPGVPVAVAAGWLARHRLGAERLAVAALLGIGFQLLYASLVGGDFMTMGRFLIPALPFAALLAGLAFARSSRAGHPCAAAIAMAGGIAANLLPAVDLHALPAAVRETFHFRWGHPPSETEYSLWVRLEGGTRADTILSRALQRHTRPGESLIRAAIGVVGYRTHLRVLDSFGLVTRQPESEHVLLPFSTPGHDRFLPWPVLLDEHPTYIHAHLAPPDAPLVYELQPDGFALSPLADMVEVLRLPVETPDLEGRPVELRLLRFRRWDPPSDAMTDLIDAAAAVDPHSEDAREELEALLPSGSTARLAQDERLHSLLAEGRIAHHGRAGFRFSRAADPTPRTRMLAVEVTLQDGDGLPQDLLGGKIVYALAISGTPTINGARPGWIAVPPGSGYVDRVTGGTALLVHLIPGRTLRIAPANR